MIHISKYERWEEDCNEDEPFTQMIIVALLALGVGVAPAFGQSANREVEDPFQSEASLRICSFQP